MPAGLDCCQSPVYRFQLLNRVFLVDGKEGQHHRNLVACLVERVSRAHRHRHQRAQRVPAEQNATIAIGDGCERNVIEGHVERAAYLFHIVEGGPRRAVASQIGDGAG